MPARGGELAMLKWISSFPDNPAHGLPTVMGVLVLSDAATSAPLAILEAGAVTALRTGAIAAVAAQALARRPARARSSAVALNGAYAARALAAAGFGPGICYDPTPDIAEGLADELGLAGRGAARGRAGLRRRHLRHPGARRPSSMSAICARGCTSTCSAPTAPARRRRRSTRSSRASCSATNGRRRHTAAS